MVLARSAVNTASEPCTDSKTTRESFTGTSVAPASPRALADAVEGLLLDRPRREAQATLALKWIQQHDADWTARAFEALYHDVPAPRRHAARADSGERHRTPGS